jgi:two-component system OmpR family response regulator
MELGDPKVLLVDDDPEIRCLVTDYLREHGLGVIAVGDARAMAGALANERVDLVLLDIMLPGKDGLTLCREIRAERNLPVILLTALSEESDRVLGLEMGADDYLVKPFSSRELLARIRAVLRRVSGQLTVHETVDDERYGFSGWHLDPAKRELVDPGGVLVSLTGGEFDLLLAFVRNPQRVLNRDRLLELTKGRNAQPFDRSIDVQLSRLRKKLKNPDLIKTVRGGGYLLCVGVERG